MKNQMKIQNEKIMGLQKSASDIKASTTSMKIGAKMEEVQVGGTKKIDFVFSF